MEGKEVDLTPIQDTVLIMSAIKNMTQATVLATKRHLNDPEALWTLTNYLTILVVSFLEELERVQKTIDDAQFQRTLAICAPAIARIKDPWQNLRGVRNSLLAHPPRFKDRRMVQDIAALMGPGKAPTRYAETILLGECAVLAMTCIVVRHQDETIRSFSSRQYEPEPAGIDSLSQIDEEMAKVIAQKLQICPDVPVEWHDSCPDTRARYSRALEIVARKQN